MPEPQDDRTPASVEKRFTDLLDKEEHRHPKGGKPENRMDQLPDGAQEEHEPNWHKEGRKAPPGWKPSGDTFVEE
jgi:hypothetical protein